MTAIHSTEVDFNSSKGQHYTAYEKLSRSRAGPVAFAQDTFTRLALYTGNTMRTGTTAQLATSQKKSNQELLSAVEDTLYSSLESAQIEGSAITIADKNTLGALEGDRSKYEITVKMFFISPAGSSTVLSVDQLNRAIKYLQTALGASNLLIDHFILALPNQTFDENGLDQAELEAFTEDVEHLYWPVWKQLSELRQGGQIGRLGVAEFSKQQLEILKAAAVSKGAVGPEVNQVNLHDCCVLPKDLIEYSKAEGIELLTHGDATNILPRSTLASLLQPHLPATSASSLTPNFVLKYSALITGRGLISRKGYIIDATAE